VTYLAELGRLTFIQGAFDWTSFIALMGFAAFFLAIGAVVAEYKLTPE